MIDSDRDAVHRLAGADAHRLQGGVALVHGDAAEVLKALPPQSVHAVVTDPPYGLVEYESADHDKLRAGRGGVWRIPPTLDGVRRSPVPRFTVLTPSDLAALEGYFEALGRDLLRVLVPGGHVIVASNPLVSSHAFIGLSRAGLHKRAEIVRLVQTLRGGDRPKNAHLEFPLVTVMPRSAWEPWGVFRTPMNGTVAKTLRAVAAGGLRRISDTEPFRDVIRSSPTGRAERAIASHPSLKPQAFLRQVVRASLPLGTGIVLDPFAGSGSTLAAAASLGYAAIGIERDAAYVEVARDAFEPLRDLVIKPRPQGRAAGTP